MGKKLLAESAAQAHYGSRMNKISDKLSENLFIVAVGETVPIPADFLTHADDLFENSNTLRVSILVVLLEALVCTYTGGRKNPLIEERAKKLYSWLDTIIPVACDAVAANLGGEPSKRWIQVLNAKERTGTSHIYNGKVSEILARMESAIDKWQIDSQHQISFSLAIDATKVAEGVDISPASKSIIVYAYPHQLISTIDKDSEFINKIVHQDTDIPILFDNASEAKICFMVAQQAAPTQSPVGIVAACP